MGVLPSIGTRLGGDWGRFLDHAAFGQGTFGETLAEQVRFRIVRTQGATIDDVRPDSAAAHQLWTAPQTGPATRRFAEGMLHLADDVSGGDAPFRGFSLSTSETGYVANRAVHSFRDGPATELRYESALLDAQRHTESTAAVRKGAWLHLDEHRSAGLLYVLHHPGATLDDLSGIQRTQLGRGVKTILHELNHLGSPLPAAGPRFHWLAEGKAEVLARWPRRVTLAGAQLGVPTPSGVGRWFDRQQAPYQGQVDTVRGLLTLAGIDHTRPAAFGSAERMLNTHAEADLPYEFAQRIARRNAPPGAHRQVIHARVEALVASGVSSDGSHADAAKVQALAGELGLR
ncbi:MAG: hypothetical protein H7287_00895 [Thermoleophilia bacterium]|nr:hypothetical protein [Thermoleophilia bacterium]